MTWTVITMKRGSDTSPRCIYKTDSVKNGGREKDLRKKREKKEEEKRTGELKKK